MLEDRASARQTPVSSRSSHARIVDAMFLEDPYPTYHKLREAGPIHWSEEFFGGAWLLTHHEDVEALLRDPRYSARRTGGWVKQRTGLRRETLIAFQRLFGRAMLFLDAPEHTRVRRVLNAGFRPAALGLIARDIETCVAELMDEAEHHAPFDFIEAFAKPLPARVIARVLGMDVRERPEFIEWSDDLARFIGAPDPGRDLIERAHASLCAMSACFEQVLSERRCLSTGGGLLADLLRAVDGGQIEGGAELLAQCAMLLFAGHETTRNLLGNGMYALLSHPRQWHRLRQDPTLLPTAIRELLRYDSPVQYTGRRVCANHVLHGCRLERGQLVIGLIGAANRDPARYHDPDRLDVARREGMHLSFGHGPHVCIGAALTSMEAEIAFRAIMTRWPTLALGTSSPKWNRNPVYRGLATLPVLRC